MNIVDILFLLLIVVSLAVGMFNGTIRLFLAVVVLYISIVLASLYFQVLGNFFRQQFRSTLEVGQITAFAVIMLVSFILLLIAGLYTFRYARLPLGLEFIDRILGTLLGLLLGSMFLSMLAVLMIDLFVLQSPGTALGNAFLLQFENSVRGSILVQVFNGYVLPLLYRTLDPLLPPEANSIFQL